MNQWTIIYIFICQEKELLYFFFQKVYYINIFNLLHHLLIKNLVS